MKSTKNTTLSRVLGSLKRKPTGSSYLQNIDTSDTSLEAIAIRNVTLFCESGTQNKPHESEDEVLYLPVIVEVCESSPSAAREAAYLLRKFLSKENCNRPYLQYNSIILIRILADNPGPTFTRNFDPKFVRTIKELLRVGQDPNVRYILVETLNKFLRDKLYYEGAELLGSPDGFQMVKMPLPHAYPRGNLPGGNSNRGLPPPRELSMRIEEARTSANLLSDMVKSSSSSEIINNELTQELADRCRLASRSIQMFISADNPAPDNDSMELLIETNEMISKALSRHQRAILNARKIQDPTHLSQTDHANSSSSRPQSKGETKKVTSERPDGPLSSEIDNKSVGRPVYNESYSHASDSGLDNKYMMHTAGPEGIYKEKEEKPQAEIPLYRY
ncbi:putative gat domain-containing protein [Golovinomyces cichoracearum]|uniref:Putative gat domain-containing protein n=1 Tax=Golovinomyces cichoracearum TaxID=62708 RepID=A0A420INR0_9PEZI|nr:putative gat domain-containing protein [Golovinomyces cichoracearum]